MNKKLNGYAKWIGIVLAILAIIWNAVTLQNDVIHLKEDISEIKQEVKAINHYLLTERDKE